MHYVHLLRLKNNSIYTGSTPNLNDRMKRHNGGFVKSTRNYRPLELVWYCAFPARLEAQQFENYLKTGSGQVFRNKRLISQSKS